MIVQYTAASIVARNKMRAMPASVDTIDSSNGQEDHVSMGANAGLQMLAVIEERARSSPRNCLTASQALHFRPEPGLSQSRRHSSRVSANLCLHRRATWSNRPG